MMESPYQVTVIGNYVTFTTDMVAPLEIIGDGNITVCGKNMLNPAWILTPAPYTSQGITFTQDNEGRVIVNGTAGNTTSPQFQYSWYPTFGDDYYFTAGTSVRSTYSETYAYDNTLSARCKQWDGVTAGLSSSSTRPLCEAQTVKDHRMLLNIRISRGTGYAFQDVVFEPMWLSKLDTDYEHYEPYKGITLQIGSTFESFEGINNVWSDTGNPVTVRYWTH